MLGAIRAVGCDGVVGGRWGSLGVAHILILILTYSHTHILILILTLT